MRLPGAMLPGLFKYLVSKPVTVLYPAQRTPVPPRLRGKLAFHKDKCISCGACARDCPSGACQMEKREGEAKKFPTFYIERCLFCEQCAESCPKDAIEMTQEFELAHYKKGEVVVR
jgi:formate hydrogenlyase subunit 6/NADH:ubiquinone oxidoreductase subunit I